MGPGNFDALHVDDAMLQFRCQIALHDALRNKYLKRKYRPGIYECPCSVHGRYPVAISHVTSP